MVGGVKVSCMIPTYVPIVEFFTYGLRRICFTFFFYGRRGKFISIIYSKCMPFSGDLDHNLARTDLGGKLLTAFHLGALIRAHFRKSFAETYVSPRVFEL